MTFVLPPGDLWVNYPALPDEACR